MKLSLYTLLTCVLIGTSGCFDEYNGTLDISNPWVRFEFETINVSENTEGPITMSLLLSGVAPTADVTIPFSISTNDDLTEGVDYAQPNSSFTIPAGQNMVVVNVLEGITNDAVPTGNRSLTITLQDTDSYIAGFPGSIRDNNAVTVTISEDDFTRIAYTSFEEPEGLDVDYVDIGDAGTSRELTNNVGQAPVQYTSIGGELGFRTFYISTGGVGATDGDDLGVTTKTSIVGDSPEGGYTDGVQGYYADDTDGIMRIEFDEVDVSALTVLQFKINYLLNDSGWEPEDLIKIDIESASGASQNILTLDGDDIDDNGLDPEPHIWHRITTDISDLISAGTIKLVIQVETDSGAEEVYFDNIVFEGIL
ncbi:MAG: hypothetical protein KI790_12360 [Cyclobacteriaceae bacterium]|nr:hypothetical protein [Cyclobacteriaceae bacterium HetDA_MAG_MS6]